MPKKYALGLVVAVLILGGVVLTRAYSYLLFHVLAETFSIIIFAGVFILAWSSRRLAPNAFLFMLGLAFLFAGILDLLHSLAFKGMAIFAGYDANLPTQLWIAARYMQSIGFLIAILFVQSKRPNTLWLPVYAGVTALMLVSMFYWNIFPVCYIEGIGLTPFKVASEYIISFILLIAIVLLWRRRHLFDVNVLRWLIASAAMTIASEMAFTLYVDVYGIFNLLGHLFKIAAVFCVYQAAIDAGFAKPFALLFRDLKQNEDALQKHRQNLQALIENADASIWSVDAQYRLIIGNALYHRNVAAAIGRPIVPGESVLALNLTPDALAEWRSYYDRALRDEKFVVEATSRFTETPQTIEYHLNPIKSPQSQIIGVTVFGRNITERKRAEESLRESKEKYRRLSEELDMRVQERTAQVQDLYDNAPCGYHSVDENGTVTLINQTELNWLGYTREQVVGILKASDIYTPESLQRIQAGLPDLIRQGFIHNLEVDLVRRDKTLLPANISATAIYDANGNCRMGRTTIFDNTERKRTDQELRDRASSLRASRDELNAANLELVHAAGLKDEFLAMMSHELRTPLNAILGLSESLQESILGPITEKQHQAIATIYSSGKHLLELINDILDLSKIEAGKIELEIEATPAVSICTASLQFIREIALKKHIQVMFSDDTQVEWITADARRLKQILVNLLSNAVKFTPKGGKVGLEVVGDVQAGIVQFTVWDTGIGIAPDQIERLFKPFVQLDSALNRQHAGTGLGLALVARLAEMHGGHIAVESEPGKGSRFILTLPWVRQTNLASGAQQTKLHDMPVVPAALQPKTTSVIPSITQGGSSRVPLILIAEDHPDNMLTVSSYLQLNGYQILFAEDGVQALAIAREQHPDLILMDIQMPIMDGVEATRRLRRESDPVCAQIPIIALTALAMRGDREKCLAAGANEYLSKPVNLKQLQSVIHQFLFSTAPQSQA